MPEPFFWPFFWIVLGVVALAAIGHGLWLLFRALLRALIGQISPSSVKPPRRPPPPAGDPGDPLLRELDAAERRLINFRQRGLLDEATSARVLEVLRADRARLAGSAPPAASPGPAVPAGPEAPPLPVAPAPPAPEPPRPAEGPPPLQPPAAPPREPRRPFAQVLASFLHEKNIRWGELIAGMLIVFCSTALVISLWQKITENPVGRFAIFLGVNTALFGAGLFTHHRWKLPQTSISLLVIATLLVPLNFLALAAFSQGPLATSATVLLAEVVAIPLFAVLTFLSGRLIAPPWAAQLALGVMVPSAAQLLIRRFAGGHPPAATLLSMGALPLGGYLASLFWVIGSRWRREGLDESDAQSIFTLLGLVSFAALLTTGLLAHITGDASRALHDLSFEVGLQGLPALLAGLFVWRRLGPAGSLVPRVAGTAVAILGALVMALGLSLAWPRPSGLVPAAFVYFAILAAAAFLFDLGPLHLFAAAFLTAGYLVGLQVAAGRIGWRDEAGNALLEEILSSLSGTALTALSVTAGAASAGLWRRRRELARYAAIAAGLWSALSLGLVTLHAFQPGQPHHTAAWIYLFYSLAAFALAGAGGGAWAAWLGSSLALLAAIQAVVFPLVATPSFAGPWPVALLIHASLMAAGAAAASRSGQSGGKPLVPPLLHSALLTSAAAAALLVLSTSIGEARLLGLRTMWLGGVWLALAVLRGSALLSTLAQAALAWALWLGVTAGLSRTLWFKTTPEPFLDPRTIQAEGTALALFLLAWAGGRISGRRLWPGAGEEESRQPSPARLHWRRLFEENRSSRRLETGLTGAILAATIGLGLYGAWPGLIQELSRSSPPPEGILGGRATWMAYESPGGWAMIGVLALLLVAGLWERFQPWRVLSLVILGVPACLLLAGSLESERATASALRWSLGFYWLLASLPIWFRGTVARLTAPLRWPGAEIRSRQLPRLARYLLLALAALPVLILTVHPFLVLAEGSRILGPVALSWFRRIGPAASYSVPLLFLSAGLIGHALRERSARLAFAGGLLINLTVTCGYLMAIWSSGGWRPLGGIEVIRLAQWNATAAAGFGLLWMAARFGPLPRWFARGTGASAPAISGIAAPPLLLAQAALAAVINLVLCSVAAAWISGRPQSFPLELREVGSAGGWLALLVSLAAAAWLFHRTTSALHPALVATGTLAAGVLAASSRAAAPGWFSYHVLLFSAVIAAWATLGAGWWIGRRGSSQTASGSATRSGRATAAAAALAVALALRAAGEDPAWGWDVAALSGVGGLAVAIGFLTRAGGWLYLAGALFNGSATICWIVREWGRSWPASGGEWLELIDLNTAVLAAPALGILLLARVAPRREPAPALLLPVYPHAAALVAMALSLLSAVVPLWARLQGEDLFSRPWPGWTALAASAALMAGCLRDRRAVFAPAGLLVAGLAAITRTLDRLHPPVSWLVAGLALLTSTYLVLWGVAWLRRARWAGALERLGAAPLEGPALQGFRSASVLTSVLVVGASVWVALGLEAGPLHQAASLNLAWRLLASGSGLVSALALGMLADGPDGGALRVTTLWIAAAAAAAWSWGWIRPGGPHDDPLHRLVLVLTALSAVTSGCALAAGNLLRSGSSWLSPIRRVLPGMVGLTSGSVVAVLLTEAVFASAIESGARPIAWPAIAVVAAAILALLVTALSLALGGTRDPLGLSERGRTAYVYAAELLLALFFMHLRLTVPQIFHGFFLRYWPIVLMAVAFLGVGLGEYFRRTKRLVLSESLQRTGLFLPFLPLMAYWLSGWFPVSRVDYSFQLFLAGLFYAGVSALRRSFPLALLAALAANGGLWHLLQRIEGLGFLQHPQLWLIPAALSVLAAAHFNRRDIAPPQMVAIRYICLITVYLASTADVFITGVARSPWMPMVLSGVSVAGVMAGIAWRVRSFLFLGSGFLLLSLLTMVWYAAERLEWTWLWWVAGIGLGVALLSLFAVFEKQRSRLLGLMEDLNQWEG